MILVLALYVASDCRSSPSEIMLLQSLCIIAIASEGNGISKSGTLHSLAYQCSHGIILILLYCVCVVTILNQVVELN